MLHNWARYRSGDFQLEGSVASSQASLCSVSLLNANLIPFENETFFGKKCITTSYACECALVGSSTPPAHAGPLYRRTALVIVTSAAFDVTSQCLSGPFMLQMTEQMCVINLWKKALVFHLFLMNYRTIFEKWAAFE